MLLTAAKPNAVLWPYHNSSANSITNPMSPSKYSRYLFNADAISLVSTIVASVFAAKLRSDFSPVPLTETATLEEAQHPHPNAAASPILPGLFKAIPPLLTQAHVYYRSKELQQYLEYLAHPTYEDTLMPMDGFR